MNFNYDVKIFIKFNVIEFKLHTDKMNKIISLKKRKSEKSDFLFYD